MVAFLICLPVFYCMKLMNGMKENYLIKVNLFIGKQNRNKIDEINIYRCRDPMSFIDLTFTI